MLYLVHMLVDIPSTMPAEEAAHIKAQEKSLFARAAAFGQMAAPVARGR